MVLYNASMIETGLRDKVVIVTGAANGIGKATAQQFAAEGCRVASWDVKAGLPESGGLFQRVDVSDTRAVGEATGEVLERLGTPYVLVNNAGILRDGQLVKYKDGAVASVLSDEQFDAVLSVNLKGVFASTRAVVPHMIRLERRWTVREFRADKLHRRQSRRYRNDQSVGARTGSVQYSRKRCGARLHLDRNDSIGSRKDPPNHAGAYSDRPFGTA
jgi:NAD(P)-dependent dehydrogenase (short-subunit alcohol dehydrogenase family)